MEDAYRQLLAIRVELALLRQRFHDLSHTKPDSIVGTEEEVRWDVTRQYLQSRIAILELRYPDRLRSYVYHYGDDMPQLGEEES